MKYEYETCIIGFRHGRPCLEGIRTIPPDISPRMNRAIQAKLTVINPTSIYGPNYFHQSHIHFNKQRFSSNVRVV